MRTQRVPVPDEPLVEGGHDYADAFEISLDRPDPHTAEAWVRAGLEGSPVLLRAAILQVHRHVLRFRLGPASSAASVLGWAVALSEPDAIHLRAEGPLLRGAMVARRRTPSTAVLCTFLDFERPRAGRLVWTAVGPIHRRVAPYLMQRAAAILSR